MEKQTRARAPAALRLVAMQKSRTSMLTLLAGLRIIIKNI